MKLSCSLSATVLLSFLSDSAAAFTTSSSSSFHFVSHSSVRQTRKTSLCSHPHDQNNNNNNNNNSSDDDDDDDDLAVKLGSANVMSRRSAMMSVATAATSMGMGMDILSTSPNEAQAINFNPFVSAAEIIGNGNNNENININNNNNNNPYQQAKRATAYLVDSTIPPTLIPFRAQREASILKSIGNGSGTQKTAFIEETLTLNNMMNKGVFTTIDLVKSITQNDDTDNDIDIDIENENTTKNNVNGNAGNIDANGNTSNKKKKKTYDATFVFLGIDYNSNQNQDVQLAIDLMNEINKPRRGLDTALSLSNIPISMQSTLDQYIFGNGNGNDSSVDDTTTAQQLINTLTNNSNANSNSNSNSNIDMEQLLPILQYAKTKKIKLIASSPDYNDIQTVRTSGLQNLDPNIRTNYVVDAEGFINWTQEPKNKLYTEKSLLKDFIPMNEKEIQNGPGGYFAESILVHETIATTMAKYVFRNNNGNGSKNGNNSKNTLVFNIGTKPNVRFMGGPNGRIARICKTIKPNTNIDEEAVTTILINPTAQETLSQSKFLRLEIGTAPKNLAYQTKVADYLWFSTMPKVNMLPRLMNG